MSRRDDTGAGVVVGLLAVAVLVGLVCVMFRATHQGEQDAAQTREATIASLTERYDVESIEVHYEAVDEEQLVALDTQGDLDGASPRAMFRAVVTIDGMRRVDCRIADEDTDSPRLDCADGEPAEREQGSGS